MLTLCSVQLLGEGGAHIWSLLLLLMAKGCPECCLDEFRNFKGKHILKSCNTKGALLV
jgi:hypothetical protein